MKNQTRKWIRGGIETLVHGGTAALIVGVTAPNIVGQLPLPYFSREWWQMVGMSFAGNGGVRFLQWWQNNPLPPDNGTEVVGRDGTTLVPETKIGLSPLSKVSPAQPQPEIPKP